ncbi:hypothetical protein Tco_1094897 [Tanacetum coccineum]
MQADLSCIHALNEPHLHEIHVVPNKHEVDQDYDSEDEFASVDNEMASFLARNDGYGTNSLLEQWKESYENDDYDYDPYDDDMYEAQEIPDKLQSMCDNLDIKVREEILFHLDKRYTLLSNMTQTPSHSADNVTITPMWNKDLEHGPSHALRPTVEENGVTRTKKYVELSAAEKIQANCGMKATNIILQGLPADIYSLVNHHRVSKDLWERVQVLMQSIVETDKVIHTVETDIVKLVVEIESFGMSSDEFDKETGSSDGLQPKQADLSCVHALNELHLHEIRVVPRGRANKEQNNESVTAELERYKERVKTFEQRLNIDLSSREKMIDSQMDDMIKEELALKEQVDSLEQNLSK